MTSIYLSSTYEDLKEYRRVVFDALRKSGYQVIAMEDYVATDQRPVDKCLKDVSGGRYLRRHLCLSLRLRSASGPQQSQEFVDYGVRVSPSGEA